MQDLDTVYETAVRRGHHIVGAPSVIAEWNFNNIFEPTVTNLPAGTEWEYGNKYFPPKTVSNSVRPKSSGIFFAFTEDAYTNTDVTTTANRYYTTGADPEIVFSYWICPTVSSIVRVGAPETGEDDNLPEAYSVERGTLLLEYPSYVNMNKVRVLFNIGPAPVDWSIFLHTQGAPGDGYVEINNPVINPITGKTEVWWSGTTWNGTQQLDETIYKKVDKIKVVVRSINQPGKHLQIVEVAGGREIDLSARVEGYNVSYQMDDVDFIAPVGRMCSSDGRITFNNTDLKINEQDPVSDFFGLLKGRCEYRTYVKYNLTDYGGSTALFTRTGTLFANDWQQTNEYEYEVELWDVFKLLQTKKVPSRLFENVSIGRIVSQILDSVGIDGYNLDPADYDDTSLVKYFWASGDETVFDVLDDLMKSYQAALYVDEFGIIQLLTRGQIANETDAPVWTFRGEQDGLDVADIETLSKKYNLQANEVTIKYNQMEASVDATDITSQPLTAKVWEATDSVVLRAAPVLRDVSEDGLDHPNVSHKDIYLSPALAATWPYKGKMNVDGEVIEYEGKGYFHWDYSTIPPTQLGATVKSDEEKRNLDKATYASFHPETLNTPGGISSDPTKQNAFSGRLATTKRDADGSGRQIAHYNYWHYGWMGLKAWTLAPGNPAYPSKYVEPGGNIPYTLNNLKDYKTRTNWNTVQTRWSVANSIAKCTNTGGDHNPSILIRDLEDPNCREFGTRLRLNGDFACGGLIFYLSNASGYDNSNPTLTDPILATRFYMLTIVTTDVVESRGRANGNEITLDVKNGGALTRLESTRKLGWGGPPVGSDGTWTINKNTWYDVDIVVKDGTAAHRNDTEATKIEVYIDGQWVDTFRTADIIRPTGLMGVHARQNSVAEFEYFYATSSALNVNPGYVEDTRFETEMFSLPSGSNNTVLNLATAGVNQSFQSVLSFSTRGTAATISSLKVKGGPPGTITAIKEIGPVVVKPDTRVTIPIDDAVPYASVVELTYTSTNELSACWEYTSTRNFPYDVEDWVTPPNTFFYDLPKGGYLSSRHDILALEGNLYPNYTEGVAVIDGRRLFSDDFGAIAHEVRDFEVEYDVKPAKSTRVFSSNNKVRVINQKYNPAKGIFTMVNASHRDEIVNGTEELNASDSIDYVLMMYGYILEDKGEKTKVVKDTASIRRYGSVSIDVDATWVFNENEATALGTWITEHWADPMDTIILDVFSNTFSQIGDKVNVKYSNAMIDESWLYIVSERTSDFDNDGLSTSVTLRRVR